MIEMGCSHTHAHTRVRQGGLGNGGRGGSRQGRRAGGAKTDRLCSEITLVCSQTEHTSNTEQMKKDILCKPHTVQFIKMSIMCRHFGIFACRHFLLVGVVDVL